MSAITTRTKTLVAILTLYVVWGTTYLAIKVGLDAELPPALFAGLRCVPAGVILLAVARWRGASLAVSRGQFRVVAIVGILLLCGGQYGTFVAEQRIASGLAALIVALLPLWIALAESALPDMQRPSPTGWLGLAIGFAGLGILLFPRFAGISAGLGALIGIGIQILATWLWSGGSIYSKRHPTRLDPLVTTGYQMLVAGFVLLALGSLLGEWDQFTMTPKGLAALAYLTVFGSCVAFTAFTYALSHAPASKVMTYAYVNPVIAVFAGWAAGRIGLVPPEPITPTMIIAMAVIVSGVAIAIRAPTRPARAPASVEGEVEPIPSEV